MKNKGRKWRRFLGLAGILAVTLAACTCLGSVQISLGDTASILLCAITGQPAPEGVPAAVLLQVRIPRILCVALVGACLSLCGSAMQSLLQNPLADGATLGVSSGAALGAALAIALNFSPVGQLPFAGTVLCAVCFAFLSMVLVLSLSAWLDRTFSSQTIILLGVVYSMFATSATSLLISFFPEKARTITFWTMGSLSGSTYANALVLLLFFLLFGGALCLGWRELNAFALGEENARNIGVHVSGFKLRTLICVSALTGICVSVGGSIGFVGLIVPHMIRMRFGPNHRQLLPLCAFFGGVFLLLADLVSRTILRPEELPVGVITSLIGTAVFLCIFYSTRKKAGQ